MRILVWAVVALCVVIPLGMAAANPLQASREAIWIVGGMAGVVALGLLLLQPVLAGDLLPDLPRRTARRWHRWIGLAIVAAILVHVGGLYLYSPSDITDALLLVAPTLFAVYGVIGLWGAVLTFALVALRSRTGLSHAVWRIVHTTLAAVVVGASIAHAVLIEGAMESISKAILCGLIALATLVVLWRTYARRVP